MTRSDQGKFSWITLTAAALCAAGAASCWVDIKSPELFPCETNADCGDDGAVCVPRRAQQSGVCCLPTPEVCDGKDNDCNGTVDDGIEPVPCYDGPAGTADVGICRSGQRICVNGQMADVCLSQVLPQDETCNGLDDDCDGQVDEGPYPDDPHNCGACGNRCLASDQCKNGACIPSSEANCENGLDEDQDGLIDCADPDCGDRACGPNLHCWKLACIPNSELDCADGADDDGDGLVDCEDVTDCKGKSCAGGGTCKQLGICQ